MLTLFCRYTIAALEAMFYRRGAAEGDIRLVDLRDMRAVQELLQLSTLLNIPSTVNGFFVQDASGAVVLHKDSAAAMTQLQQNAQSGRDGFDLFKSSALGQVAGIIMGYAASYAEFLSLSSHDCAEVMREQAEVRKLAELAERAAREAAEWREQNLGEDIGSLLHSALLGDELMDATSS